MKVRIEVFSIIVYGPLPGHRRSDRGIWRMIKRRARYRAKELCKLMERDKEWALKYSFVSPGRATCMYCDLTHEDGLGELLCWVEHALTISYPANPSFSFGIMEGAFSSSSWPITDLLAA
ncbi:hypothetical protein IH979_00640 [Patescibacteria group bacterium]|nr:hypothetical protein [Patescibacteria group bacterium]